MEMNKSLASRLFPELQVAPSVNADGHKDQTTVVWDNTTLPKELIFTEDALVPTIAYPCLFVIAAGGNLIVLITLLRSRGCKSRVNVFIMHLTIADLIVAFIFMPLETTWHATVSWQAGDLACRICMFFRAFGFYLSSFLLVTISLDRYISIVHPLTSYNAKNRTRWMIGMAWALSFVCSLPQVRVSS